MQPSAKLAIIGAGAAGLTAAIFAAQSAGSGNGIVILDTAKTPGAKILVSGGGRCNVTHDVVEAADFNGSRNIIRKILAAFPPAAAVQWFASLGVQLKREDTGKLFPTTDSAHTVLNALLHRCEKLGVTLLPDHRVKSVVSWDNLFTIEHTHGSLESPKLILATGGQSLPKTGSDGSGWQLARQLGHDVTPPHAALVPLVLAPQMFHAAVAGISIEVELSTFANGKRIDSRTGSLLWTHFGISGPVVMDASRHWVIAHETAPPSDFTPQTPVLRYSEEPDRTSNNPAPQRPSQPESKIEQMMKSPPTPTMQANLLPPETFESVERWLLTQCTARPKAAVTTILSERLPARLAAALAAHTHLDPALTAGHLPREARRALVHNLTALPLQVQNHRGWNYAEVTAGGIPLTEIEPRTLQSRKRPGLYLAGEILDCDGKIGGFNFQWAWATGYLAGTAASAASE